MLLLRRQPAPLAGRSRPAAYPAQDFSTTPHAKYQRRRILPHRRCAWLLPPAPSLVAPLWRTQLSFYGDRHSVFVRNDDRLVGGRTAPRPDAVNPHSLAARAATTRRHLHRCPESPSQGTHRTSLEAPFRIVSPASCVWPAPTIICTPPTRSCAVSCPTTTAASVAHRAKQKKLGGSLLKISIASAAFITNAASKRQ